MGCWVVQLYEDIRKPLQWIWNKLLVNSKRPDFRTTSTCLMDWNENEQPLLDGIHEKETCLKQQGKQKAPAILSPSIVYRFMFDPFSFLPHVCFTFDPFAFLLCVLPARLRKPNRQRVVNHSVSLTAFSRRLDTLLYLYCHQSAGLSSIPTKCILLGGISITWCHPHWIFNAYRFAVSQLLR